MSDESLATKINRDQLVNGLRQWAQEIEDGWDDVGARQPDYPECLMLRRAADLLAQWDKDRAEIERLKEGLTKIVRGEEEAPVGMSNPAEIARNLLEPPGQEL